MSAWGQMGQDEKLKLPKHWVEASLILGLELVFFFKFFTSTNLALESSSIFIVARGNMNCIAASGSILVS